MSFATARENMVLSQLRPNAVSDEDTLRRFLDTPREAFVDASAQHVAYLDQPVDMGHGRMMHAPMVLARLLQAMAPQHTDQVLLVAAGTGYTAALLSPLVEFVVAVEENPYLIDSGRKAHSDLHLKNIKWVEDKPEKGCKAHAPYDCIILDATADTLPDSLVQQLKEGGRLLGVLKGTDGLHHLTTLTRQGQTLFTETQFVTSGHPLPNFAQPEGFVF